MKYLVLLLMLAGCAKSVGKYEVGDCGKVSKEDDVLIEILDKSNEAYFIKMTLKKEGYHFVASGKTTLKNWYRMDEIDLLTYKINCEE